MTRITTVRHDGQYGFVQDPQHSVGVGYRKVPTDFARLPRSDRLVMVRVGDDMYFAPADFLDRLAKDRGIKNRDFGGEAVAYMMLSDRSDTATVFTMQSMEALEDLARTLSRDSAFRSH